MIELASLTMWNRLINWGLAPIIATRTVAADGDTLRTFLSIATNQWRLASSSDAVARHPAREGCDGQLRLPLGGRVPVGMHVRASRTGRVLTTELQLWRRTVACATWLLSPDRGTTEVDLALQLNSRNLATRLVMVLGGRRWIARRLDAALATLATTSARVAEDVVATPAAHVTPRSDARDRQAFAVQRADVALGR